MHEYKNLTICVYQNEVAEPDIRNWISDKIQKGFVKSLDTKFHGLRKIHLEFEKDEERFSEDVWILPDAAFKAISMRYIKVGEHNIKVYEDDYYFKHLLNFKFVYIGSIKPTYADDILTFYESIKKKLSY